MAAVPGFVTLTDRVRTVANSATGIVTVMDVGVMADGIRTSEPKFTVAPAPKPVPAIVSDLKSPFIPVRPKVGESRVSVGDDGGGTEVTIRIAENYLLRFPSKH